MNSNKYIRQLFCIAAICGIGHFSSAAVYEIDGQDIEACKSVTPVCIGAKVTATLTKDVKRLNKKKGETVEGYLPGAHSFTTPSHGLWADCVAKIAGGKTVEGVTGITQDAAKACMTAEKTAHPGKKQATLKK